MKQITHKEAEKLALADPRDLKFEIECCQAEWIAANSRYIAEIETKRTDKTHWGEYPKGWKSAMLKDSKEKAKSDIVSRFIARKCREIDGALWLNDWQMICEMEKPTI
jgi:hypothetical protein